MALPDLIPDPGVPYATGQPKKEKKEKKKVDMPEQTEPASLIKLVYFLSDKSRMKSEYFTDFK